MDVVRTRARTVPPMLLPGLAVGAALVAAWFAAGSLLHPAPALPSVARDALVVDVARVETLVRAVRAPGLLVSDRVHVVTSLADGIVTDARVRAGSRVSAGTIVVASSNPDLEAAVVDARTLVTTTGAQLRSVREEARASKLDREGDLRSASAETSRTSEEARTYGRLIRDGLVGTLPYRESVIKADAARDLAEIARRKIDVDAIEGDAKIAVARAAVARARAALAVALARVDTLTIRANASGVVETMSADVGARLPLGTEVARIADERDLKAVLHVAEGDVGGVATGMDATLETNGAGTIRGHVARIAPVSVDGSIAVDVALDATSSTLRPAQTVDGTIVLRRAHRGLTIARPPGAADGGTVTVYRVLPGGQRAVRTRVRLGSGSLDRVEVLAGLTSGENVIVSDTSSFDTAALRITP